jgi:hypothetical protein
MSTNDKIDAFVVLNVSRTGCDYREKLVPQPHVLDAEGTSMLK